MIKESIARLQKLLKLDLDFFIKGTFFTTVQQTVGALSGIIITFAFARFTSKEFFGQYNLITSFLKIASIFSLSGFSIAIIQSTLKGYNKALLQSIKPRLKASFLGSLFLGLAGIFYLLVKNQTHVGYTLILASPLLPFLYSFNAYNSYLKAKKLFKKAAIYSSIPIFINTLAVITTLILTKNLVIVSLSYILSYITAHLYSFIKTKKLISLDEKKDPNIKSFSIFMTLVSSLSFISSHIDKIILGSLLGYEQLAIYSIAVIAPLEIGRNLKSFITLPSIKIIPKNIKDNIKAVKTHLVKLLLIGMVLASIGWLLIPYFIKILYTSAYKQSIFYSQILMITLIFAPLNLLLQNVVIYQKQKKETIFLTFFPALPKIILYLILIPTMGILGAVLANLFENVLLFIYFYYKFLKTHE
jgi:O-antigen/teichoic acid export membrane protein